MAYSSCIKLFLLAFLLLTCLCLSAGTRKLTTIYQPPPMLFKYHKGTMLQGDVPVSILWYGKFTPPQKSVVSDFILSLTPPEQLMNSTRSPPSVSLWWKTIDKYTEMAQKQKTRVHLSTQISDEKYSHGKTIKRSQISELTAQLGRHPGGVTLVLTDDVVAVEGFCMSSCGHHGADPSKQSAFIWVGNPATQCPGQCAWPFHQPIYGPQGPPLVAPNNDVGLDGMIINIATLLAGTVTNPYGGGFFQGPADAPVEASTACTGIYGKGAYPGFAGEVLMDEKTGASYNAQGVNGRKYMLPAVYDPAKLLCSTLV